MNGISIRLIQKSEELPEMVCDNFFHSTDFFLIAEKRPAMLRSWLLQKTGTERCTHTSWLSYAGMEDCFRHISTHTEGFTERANMLPARTENCFSA